MTLQHAGILSIATGFPKHVRSNDWFKENQPDAYAAVEKKSLAQVFSPADKGADTSGAHATRTFDAAMARYLTDPFRGTKERRVMAAGDSQIDLEADVAREAIAKAGLAIEDIDQILVAAFPTEHPGVGDGVYLARALGTRRPAVNIETACSGGVAGLQLASALVQSGQARHVLVVVSCVYSKACDWADTLTWFLGDGVGAYVVGPVPAGEGFLSFHSMNTAESCGAFEYALEVDDGGARAVIRAGAEAGRALREMTPRAIETTCHGALRSANLAVGDIDFFITNTPLAWFTETFAATLGVSTARTVSTYEEFANMGPALNPVNLHAALSRGLILPGATVLLFSIGSVSTAAASVVRIGRVGVGARVER